MPRLPSASLPHPEAPGRVEAGWPATLVSGMDTTVAPINLRALRALRDETVIALGGRCTTQPDRFMFTDAAAAAAAKEFIETMCPAAAVDDLAGDGTLTVRVRRDRWFDAPAPSHEPITAA